MKTERSLAPVSTTNRYFKRFVSFSSPRPIRKKHMDRVFLSSALWVVGSGLSAVGSGLSLPIYSPPLGHVRHSFHRSNTNHSDSLHTSDGALICFALMSHCRAVWRGNLVFCSTHRNLSVYRSTEYKSFGFPAYVRRCIDMLALMSHRRAVCRGNLVFCRNPLNFCTHPLNLVFQPFLSSVVVLSNYRG